MANLACGWYNGTTPAPHGVSDDTSAILGGTSMFDLNAIPSFGPVLRRHRLAAGLTQEVLAERSGVAERTLQDLERGVTRPRRQTVRRLIGALRLTAEAQAEFEAATSAPRQRRSGPARVNGLQPSSVNPRVVGDPVARGLGLAAHQRLIPTSLTSFIGRERELAELAALVETQRLVTLTGPGGAGKTRLALELADRVHGTYPDGAYIVSLASLTDPRMVAATISEAFGLYEATDSPLSNGLARFIGEKTVLGLLDNFEHLVPAGPLLLDLLSACPKLTLLITSREILHLRGEQVYPVPPLTLPEGKVPTVGEDVVSVVSESEAVRLFVDRARSSRPSFRLDASNAGAVADICRRLDGLPLAIELAAVRIRHLTPDSLRLRLEHRLEVLTGGAHDLPARQRTLRDAIAWSYDLLGDLERSLFRRLSAFEGGCSLDAAKAVCCEDTDPSRSVIGDIETLIDQHLVQQHDGPDGEPRFTMLETIREYARERLEASGEGAIVRDRHAAWYLAFVEAAEPKLRGPQQVVWLERLRIDHDNVRGTLRYAVETHGAEIGLRLAGALWRFWQVHGHLREGRDWLGRLLVLPEASARTGGRARALNAAGFVAFLLGDYATARALHEQGLAIRRELGERLGVIESLHNLGLTVRCQGEHAAAQAHFLEGLAMSRTTGSRFWEARILLGLARTYFYQGEHSRSGGLLEESLRIGSEVGDLVGQAIALGDLSDVAHAAGDAYRARSLIGESFALWRDLRDERGMAQCAEGLALQLGAIDHFDPAVRLLSSAAVLRVEIGEPPSPSRRQQLVHMQDRARTVLGDAAYARAWGEGCARPTTDVVDERLATPAPQAGTADAPSAFRRPPATGRVGPLEHAIAYALSVALDSAAPALARTPLFADALQDPARPLCRSRARPRRVGGSGAHQRRDRRGPGHHGADD